METTISDVQMVTPKKLSRLTLFAYGCGDFASNLCWTFISSYLTIFYTDVVGLAPAVASALLLVARIWDGINDPMFGAIAERTRTVKGRFRPYIYYGTPFLAIFSVLTFTVISNDSSVALGWAAFTYIGCGMLYTVVNLSYGSLSTVMTTDPEDIAQLNSWRMMGTNLSSVIISAVTPPLLMYFSGGGQGYTAMGYTKVAIVFAICAVPLFYFVYSQCKETVIPPQSAVHVPVSQSIKSVLSNKPLMLIFAIQLLALTGVFGRLGVVIYYLIYDVQRFDLIALFMALPTVFTVLGIFAMKGKIVAYGKKRMAAIGYIMSGLTLIALYFVGETQGYTNIPVLLGISCLFGLSCFSMPIPMAMVVDAINYQEERTGVRSDGISYAAVSLSTKFGSAIGAAVGLAVMGATGYIANTQQTAAAMSGINMTANLLMGIVFLCCLIPLWLYPLNEEKNAEILASLEKKRAQRALENA